jgi:hypothetical protein
MVAEDLRQPGLRLPDIEHAFTARTRVPESPIDQYYNDFGGLDVVELSERQAHRRSGLRRSQLCE